MAQAFNAVFRELVTVVKNETTQKDVKNAVKSAYRVWNSAASTIADAFHETFGASYDAVMESGVSSVPSDSPLVAGMPLQKVVESMDPEFVPRVEALVLGLFALSIAERVLYSSDDKPAFADAYARVQKELAGVDGTSLEEVILDEDIVKFVKDAGAKMRETGGACGLPVMVMPDNAILAIAKDISDGIDPDMLSRPDGMQALVQSVSAGIGQRIGNGEIDPAALMKDASAMLANVDMSEIMKMMGGMGIDPAMLASGMAGFGAPPGTPKKK
jgi:hypothetical protein